jgi:hypothetical protein
MRKVYVPLTVLGLAGLGLLILSDRGRKVLRWLEENLQNAPDALLEWNDAAQHELDRIEAAVNRLAESLHAAH